MRRFSSSLSSMAFPGVALTLAVCAVACSKLGGGGGGNGNGNGGDDGPHALGTVLLSESHPPSGGASTPNVAASFIPDASLVPLTCATQVDGCSFVSTPQCGGSGSSCGQGEACTWDSACNATCTAACTLQCQTGQECYFVSPGLPACRPTETFDAGVLAFGGTTTPITLFPPYQYQASSTTGAPFLAGGQLEVQASGAVSAGFDKFDEKFTATSFLQTNPPIDTISAAVVFGSGPIPIAWAAGSDTLTIAVSGAAGVATCTATDSSGSFQIPRDAVNAALGSGGTSALSITVTREHDDWFKDEGTHGTLASATVQPVGWLEVSTASIETASFQGCTVSGQTMCPDGCFDTQADQYHCGNCTTVCGANETCQASQCSSGSASDCSACQTSADDGTCMASLTTCADDSECASYTTCSTACAAGDTTCLAACEEQYPIGFTDYQTYQDCICLTACPTQCASICGG